MLPRAVIGPCYEPRQCDARNHCDQDGHETEHTAEVQPEPGVEESPQQGPGEQGRPKGHLLALELLFARSARKVHDGERNAPHFAQPVPECPSQTDWEQEGCPLLPPGDYVGVVLLERRVEQVRRERKEKCHAECYRRVHHVRFHRGKGL